MWNSSLHKAPNIILITIMNTTYNAHWPSYLPSLGLQRFHTSEYLPDSPGNNTFSLLCIKAAFHCVGLAGSRLAICKNAYIVAIKGTLVVEIKVLNVLK